MNHAIKIKLTIALACIIYSLPAHAQNISGYWMGSLYTSDPNACFSHMNIEVHIIQADKQMIGTSYYYTDTNNYISEEFEGEADSITKDILLIGLKLVDKKITENCKICLKDYLFRYSKTGNTETLKGRYAGKSSDNISCPKGDIVLTKSNTPAFERNNPKEKLIARNNIITTILQVDTGLIEISLYDNAQIDGDIISVFVNNKQVVNNEKLTATPIKITIKIDAANKNVNVIMVGENMGTIPPNTANMIIKTQAQKHSLFLSSDEKQNATVRFTLKNGIAKRRKTPEFY